jgi:Skp family chaperone for outer membrane proteins
MAEDLNAPYVRPHTEPDPPLAEVDHGPELLAVHDTATLQRMHDALRNPIPGDATFIATVAALLRSLVTREISNPDRIKRDADAAKRDEEAKAELLKAKQEAEKKALADRALTPEEKAKQEADDLERKHADEIALAERTKAQADLAAKQVEERKEFETRQAEARASLVKPLPSENTGSVANPYPNGPPPSGLHSEVRYPPAHL